MRLHLLLLLEPSQEQTLMLLEILLLVVESKQTSLTLMVALHKQQDMLSW